MIKSHRKRAAVAVSPPNPDAVSTSEHTLDAVRAILWGIARDPKQSATARVGACNLLLRDAREHDGGEAHASDLNKRALVLMRRVSN